MISDLFLIYHYISILFTTRKIYHMMLNNIPQWVIKIIVISLITNITKLLRKAILNNEVTCTLYVFAKSIEIVFITFFISAFLLLFFFLLNTKIFAITSLLKQAKIHHTILWIRAFANYILYHLSKLHSCNSFSNLTVSINKF